MRTTVTLLVALWAVAATAQQQATTLTLHEALERELGGLGYREENRRFRPHLTIGRVRQSPVGIEQLGRLIEENAGFESGLSTVYEVTVFASQLGREGPTYEPLCHADLKGR